MKRNKLAANDANDANGAALGSIAPGLSHCERPRSRHSRHWRLGFGLLLISVSMAAQGTYTLNQVLVKMGDAGKKFTSMQSAIERTRVTVIVNDKSIDSGNVYFSKHGKDSSIKMEITKPSLQTVLIDNGKAVIYSPKLKQAQEFSIGKNQNKAEFLLIGFGNSKEDIDRAYDTALRGEETIDGNRTSILELKPKDPRQAAMFTNIKLWVDQQRWIPIQIQTTEASRDYTIMKLTNIKMNARISDSTFDLKLPKDVQIVKPSI